MATTSKVEARPADPRRGLTLDELGAFVQEALRAGADGSEAVGAEMTVSFRPVLKRLTVEVAVPAPAREA